MSNPAEIAEYLRELLLQLLRDFDTQVTDSGAFSDYRVKMQFHYGDPATTLPGMLEIAVMNMDENLDTRNRDLRFVAVRVKKSPRGGSASSTCFHGTKAEVRQHLQDELQQPTILLQRVQELASGLPEETNPALWR